MHTNKVKHGKKIQLSVLTVNYFSGRFTELLAHSLFKLNPKAKIEMHIFDNGSSDGSLNFVENFELGKIHVSKEIYPYPAGSASHGFAVDSLLNQLDHDNSDVICIIDNDCFSFTINWLNDYCDDSINHNYDIIAAQAFCPTVENENKYMWPGFTLYHPSWIEYIINNQASFIPNSNTDRVNDSGQMTSIKIEQKGARVLYLPRTPPNKIGNLSLEKWSIDSKVNHFFAASMAGSVRNPLSYVYGDKSRGRYITKLFKAWRLFRQKEVMRLLSNDQQ